MTFVIYTGRSVAFPGHPLGSGLTPTAAQARNFCVEEFISISNGLPLRSFDEANTNTRF